MLIINSNPKTDAIGTKSDAIGTKTVLLAVHFDLILNNPNPKTDAIGTKIDAIGTKTALLACVLSCCSFILAVSLYFQVMTPLVLGPNP